MTRRRGFLTAGVLIVTTLAAGSATAMDYYVEAPNSVGLVKHDLEGAYTENAGAWGETSAKSKAAGCTPGVKARYSYTAGAKCTFSFQPNETGLWTIDLTWGATTAGDTDVTWTVYDADGVTVLCTGRVNMFQGNGSDMWNSLGSYTFTVCNTYTVVLTNPGIDGSTYRMMGDAIRLTHASACSDVPSLVLACPILVGDDTVTVHGVSVMATAVNIYDLDTGCPPLRVGFNNSPGGFGAVAVSIVPPPLEGHRLVATQVVYGIESCWAGAPWCQVVRVPGDFNGDADADSDDLEVFGLCMSGPAVHYAGDCLRADFDLDGDVDQDDFGVFQRCYSGADQRGDPSCGA